MQKKCRFDISDRKDYNCFIDEQGSRIRDNIAGWSSLEARRAHNPKVIGSNPIPATTEKLSHSSVAAFSDCGLKIYCMAKETGEGKAAVCYNEQK